MNPDAPDPRQDENEPPQDRNGDHDDQLFEWVTDFENPVVTKAQARRAPRAASRVPVAPLVGGGAFLMVAATVITALLRPFEAEGGIVAEPTRTPQAPSPTASATAPAPEALPDMLPPDCTELYGNDMMATFAAEGMEVNQAWTGSREAPAGTSDARLRVLLEPKASLDCFWLDADGGAEMAVLTSVSVVSAEEDRLIAARLVERGFAQQEDRKGVRYYLEHTVDGETVGESHFLRDNVWFATNWYGFGPWGYTGHMVDQVFS